MVIRTEPGKPELLGATSQWVNASDFLFHLLSGHTLISLGDPNTLDMPIMSVISHNFDNLKSIWEELRIESEEVGLKLFKQKANSEKNKNALMDGHHIEYAQN